MSTKHNTLNFKNQQFSVGLDVHQKDWKVTIRSNKLVLNKFSMNPEPEELAKYLKKTYPGGEYYSVYEAGFCGYHIHRKLTRLGIKNIIAAPTEIPTSYNEKESKSDPVDSGKLARELENKSLKGIYVPDELHQELRSLIRLRYQKSKAQARLKNQIKSYLNFYGHKYPGNYQMRNWTKAFIKTLRELQFIYPIGKRHLQLQLDSLISIRAEITEVLKSIREYLREYKIMDIILLLTSVPGVGFLTAVTIYSELIAIDRFGRFDKLAKYCGLVPSVRSSSERKQNLGISKRVNNNLRNMLIESAWIAVRKDPALTCCYNEYLRRMSKQEAIIRIAKKLLSRIRYVWTSGKKYVSSVVK